MKKIVLIFTTILLFIIPFFWLTHGEMDIGGDSQRLYFYDPISLLKNFSLYAVAPWGTGKIYYNQYFLIYILELAVLKSIFGSSTLIINLLNGLKLALSFFFIFLILKELRNKTIEGLSWGEYAGGIIGALFYTLSPSLLDNLKFALITHDMVFVNPIIFYFLLRYLKTSLMWYVWVTLLITLVFSSSFALFNPPLYAFYPLSLMFLISYNHFILKNKISWKGITFFAVFFIGLHAFHMVPVVATFFDKSSEINKRTLETFSGKNVGLDYFNAVHSLSKVSSNLLLPLEIRKWQWTLLFIPLLMLLGFLIGGEKKKETIQAKKTTILLTVFFIITLYMVSANITDFGVSIYRWMFLIPGFGMFRNFSGVWQFIYIFFYSLIIGTLISSLFNQLKKKYVFIISFCILLFFIARSQNLFNGKFVKVTARGSSHLVSTIRVKPEYEKMLRYIGEIPSDGKILHIPFTDFPYNLVAGENNGVYIGQSMVGFLKGKNAYSGYPDIDPFSEVVRSANEKKNYSLIQRVFSLLQVRYILYDADERVSNKYFPTFPYGYSGIPASTSGGLKFINHFNFHMVKKIGSYSLLELDKTRYLPKVYFPSRIYLYDVVPKYNTEYYSGLSFFSQNLQLNSKDSRIAFMERNDCKKIFSAQKCKGKYITQRIQDIQLSFQKVNPTKYKVSIKNIHTPELLIFQSAFSSQWKMYQGNFKLTHKIYSTYYNNGINEYFPQNNFIDSNPFETNYLSLIYGSQHISVNSYANGWYIHPNKKNIDIVIEMSGQKVFYFSFIVSVCSFIIFCVIGFRLFLKK